MELRELRYFVQIANDHSYTKAAEHLYVSQPALSKMMKKLESELSIPLFVMKSSGVYLSDYGEMLYDKVVPLLNQFDSLKSFISDVRGLKGGKLRVGVTPMLGTLFFVDVVVNFCNQYPGVELKLSESGSKAVRQQLVEENLDIGICITGDANELLEDTILFQDEMVVCLLRTNPLSAFSSLRFEQLKDECFNMYSSSSTLYTQIFNRCIQAGFEPKINISSSKINMIMQMTAKGKGICILPRPYAIQYLSSGLKLVSLKEPFPWTGCMVKNKTAYQSYVSKRFEAFVMDYFTEQPSPLFGQLPNTRAKDDET